MAIAYILRKTVIWILWGIPIHEAAAYYFGIPLPDPQLVLLLNLIGATVVGFINGDLCFIDHHREGWE